MDKIVRYSPLEMGVKSVKKKISQAILERLLNPKFELVLT